MPLPPMYLVAFPRVTVVGRWEKRVAGGIKKNMLQLDIRIDNNAPHFTCFPPLQSTSVAAQEDTVLY